jgi:hypothetical protein
VRDVDADSMVGIPQAIDGRAYQFVDLDGEGVPGVLSQQGPALYYKKNLGQGKLGRPEALRSKPTATQLGVQRGRGRAAQLLDVTGSGMPALVDFGRGVAGYYPREDDETFGPFRSFGALPNVDWSDPSLRFIDLDGDGYADVLMSGSHVYTWWPFECSDQATVTRRRSRLRAL